MKKKYVITADVDFEPMFEDYKGNKPKVKEQLKNYVWQAMSQLKLYGIRPIQIEEKGDSGDCW